MCISYVCIFLYMYFKEGIVFEDVNLEIHMYGDCEKFLTNIQV